MIVVAEGVESAETMEWLEALGCDVAQGFLFSPALPSDELEAWLNADRGRRLVTEVHAGERNPGPPQALGIRVCRLISSARCAPGRC
jgi:predicted signal transduction protein with EAL and GGDEF domain